MFGEFEIDVAVEEYVDAGGEISGANVFVAEIGVGDFALIEGVADPSDGIGVGPGDPDADAWGLGFVLGNFWWGCNLREVQAEFFGS